MHLMIEFPGDRMVPRQRFGPIPQLLMGAASEQGAQAFATIRQVAQQLQHIEQDRNRYRVQHNGLERAQHLDQSHGSNWNEPTQGAQRDLETPRADLIGGEPSRGML